MQSFEPRAVAARTASRTRPAPLLAAGVVVALLAGAVFVASGLSTTSDPGRAGLGAFEGDWRLKHVLRSGVPQSELAAYEITLTVRPGALSGAGPCNRYRLAADLVRLDATTLRVEVTLSSRTAASCGKAIDRDDDFYITTLSAVTVGSLDPTGDELRLGAGAVEFVFERIPS
jgi:hypothetical protein